MNQQHTTPTWGLANKAWFIPGYVHGCRYPSLVLTIQGAPLSRQTRDRLWNSLRLRSPSLAHHQPEGGGPLDWRQSIDWLLAGWQALLASLGVPVHEKGRILVLSTTQARVVVPVTVDARQAIGTVILRTLGFLNRASTGEPSDDDQPLADAIEALRHFSAKGSNTPWFVHASFVQGIPFQWMPEGVYQYGVAKYARWMHSSFTDVTPTISAKLARSKIGAAALLRKAGVPVPLHRLVTCAEDALKAAAQLGYPVVVKPADLDGGIGVAAGLESEREVTAAFDAARKHSRRILVEKHFHGKDYRLVVLNGEMIWAIERVPGGVHGDGKHTVSELVDLLNADPRRGSGNHTPLKQLVLDDEACELLGRQGLAASSIPEVGQFVRFRRAANIAGGGTPVAVFDRVHPDNARLAVRAANALRLDLAGIDLLIPDIATSWRESGAAICEVNGQPNLGHTTSAHLYSEILGRLVSNGGRVPTVVVVSRHQASQWLAALSGALQAHGLRVGVAGPRGIMVNDEVLHPGPLSPYDGGQMLVMNRDVDAMVIAISDDSVLHSGLPVDRYDVLIVADTPGSPAEQTLGANAPEDALTHLVTNLLAACDGIVMTRPDDALGLGKRKGLTLASWHPLEPGIEPAAGQAVRWLQGRAPWPGNGLLRQSPSDTHSAGKLV